MSLESDVYPTDNEISDIKTCESLLSESLRKLLEVLIKGRLKRSSAGQVITSVARQRSAVFPITFRLGAEMDNMFGSCWLIDELTKLSFSISYNEIKRYKQSFISNNDSLSATATRKSDFVQWVADNVDHNISTLDRKNTFHGIGITAISIGKMCNSRKRIPREKQKSLTETTGGKAIPIKQYLHDRIKALASIKLKSIKDLNISSDLLWQMGYFFLETASLLVGFYAETHKW